MIFQPERARGPVFGNPKSPSDYGSGQEQARIEQLEAARGQIEVRFLGAGTMLSETVDGIGLLIATLDKLIESSDPVTVRATIDDLTHAAAKLAALPPKQAARRSVLEAMGEFTATLHECIFEMRRSLNYMRAFAVNIKITGSSIAAYNADFGLFAESISGCIELGRTELDGLQADVVTLSRELKMAGSDGLHLQTRCDALIPAIPDELNGSATVMHDHYKRVAAAASEAAKLARDVRNKVGRILGALQVGDITRQRIEHVQHGLALLQEARRALPLEHGVRLGNLVHSLLAAQLEATVQDFVADMSEIDASMAGLGGDLVELMRLGDLAYGRTTGEQGGILRKLEHRVEQALGLVNEVEAADRVALQTGTAAATAARALATRVTALQTIKADVHYMAVNTTLKSSRVGEAGRPLSVIAVELRAHGGHLEKSAAGCLAVLENLTSSAAVLTEEQSAEPGGETETQAAASALGAAAERIRTAGDKMESDVAVLSGQGAGLQTSLNGSLQQSKLLRDIAETLNEAMDSLTSSGVDATLNLDGIDKPLLDISTRLSSIYTMAQERAVHRSFAAACNIDVDEPALPAVSDELEDALF